MKIRLEQKNIGAALMQIAEHPQFTAINALKINGEVVNNGFLVNNNIAVFCKYASEPNDTGEYVFTFTQEHISNIKKAKKNYNVFLALICVEDGEICQITDNQLETLIQNRKTSAKKEEEQYTILVTMKSGTRFRVYVNAAGRRGRFAGEKIIVARRAFPDNIFS